MFDQAQANLDTVTNQSFADLKSRLERSLVDHKQRPTNSVPELPAKAPPPPAKPSLAPAAALISPAATNLQVAPPDLRSPSP
jgi:hypothetical protein